MKMMVIISLLLLPIFKLMIFECVCGAGGGGGRGGENNFLFPYYVAVNQHPATSSGRKMQDQNE